MTENEKYEYISDYEDEESNDSSEKQVDNIGKDNLNLKDEQLKLCLDDVRTAKNKTFTYFQIREIQNSNQMLMKKVLAHTNRPTQYKTLEPKAPKISSAEINRRKKQKQIDHDNLVLLKKIQSIKPFGMSKVKVRS